MCIFDGPIAHVSSTKIFVTAVMQSKIVTIRDTYGKARRVRRPAENTKPLQLTVYSNYVQIGSNHQQAAMILPFPLLKKQKNRVKILDLSKCSTLFKRMDKLFKKKKYRGMIMQNAIDYTFDDDETSLVVHTVGSYKASVVPNFAAFDMLQYNQFSLSPEVKNLLQQHYSTDYGFMVCILRDNADYHPFGYVHELRSDGKLFVPTRHFHSYDGNANPFQYTEAQTRIPEEDYDLELDVINQHMARTITEDDPYLQHTMRHGSVREVARVDWDHSVYIFNYGRIVRDTHYQKKNMEITSAEAGRLYNIDKYFNPVDFPSCVIFPKIVSAHRLNIYSGYQNNHDLLI
jgi:hypothetical protein